MQRQSYPSPIITLKVQNHHHLSTSPPLLIGEPPFESPSICSNVPWRHCLAWQLFFRARLSIMISAQGIPGFSSKKKNSIIQEICAYKKYSYVANMVTLYNHMFQVIEHTMVMVLFLHSMKNLLGVRNLEKVTCQEIHGESLMAETGINFLRISHSKTNQNPKSSI